jgi:acyl-CoA synthetase (AMP-forming)/AMP-acid ligase II
LLQDSLQRTAQKFPNKIAIISGEDRIRYGELWQRSVQMANALKVCGIKRGDRVAIYLDNTWQCAVSVFGSLLADAAFVLINPQTKSDKLAYILKDSAARALVAESALWPAPTVPHPNPPILPWIWPH